MSADGRSEPKVVFAAIFPVEDFDSWRNVEGLDAWLAEAGVVAMNLYRGADDSNDVMALLEMRSEEAAEALVTNEEFRIWLDRSGVSIYPSVFVGREVRQVDYRP